MPYSLSIRTIACSLQLKTDDLLIYFFSRFFRRIEPSRTKYPPTDTNTESSAEQSTEMNSISTQSDLDDLSTPTTKTTSKSYTKYEISHFEQGCCEQGYYYNAAEQETDDDASIERRQSSLSIGSIRSETANWSMFNFAQFDDRNENTF